MMNTDELIASLTRDLQPAPPRLVSRLLGYGALIGVALALLLVSLVYDLRDDLSAALFSAPFWMKWTYAISLCLCAYLLCERLARPGAPAGYWLWLPLLPMTMLAALALRTQWQLSETARMATWLGHSAAECPFNIALISVPVFAVLCRALRRAAPTQLRLCAAIAGLLSGGIAAFAYGLYCTESSVAFVATWYTLGMMLPALAGLLFGPALLRWR